VESRVHAKATMDVELGLMKPPGAVLKAETAKGS
jgi:hypothetical protein